MKKLGLLLLLSFMGNGNLLHAYDEHQAETKFLEKELYRVKRELREVQQTAQALVMIIVKEKMRSAEEATMRIQASSEAEPKNEETQIESENNNNAQVVAPVKTKQTLTNREWAQRMVSEHKKEAIAIGVTGIIAIGGIAWKIVKDLVPKK